MSKVMIGLRDEKNKSNSRIINIDQKTRIKIWKLKYS